MRSFSFTQGAGLVDEVTLIGVDFECSLMKFVSFMDYPGTLILGNIRTTSQLRRARL